MQGRPVVKTMRDAMDGPEYQLSRWDDTQNLILCNREPGASALPSPRIRAHIPQRLSACSCTFDGELLGQIVGPER